MIRLMALLTLAALLLAAPASAQVTVAHDTLGGDSPVAITCGFCATERYGVVFRDLPAPARGLVPTDFPLTLRSLLVAVANARVTGSGGSYMCAGEAVAGNANVDLEVWAGSEAPTGSIRDLPADGAWNASESLVWAGVDIPLTRSASDAPGSLAYMAAFNELMLVDDMDAPIVVDAGETYLRVVITLKPDATDRSASCVAAGNASPAAFPIRDDDGVVAPENDFGYALGLGWFWNEEPGFGIGGDWAIRLSISPSSAPAPDGGVADAGSSDAGVDASVDDASTGGDAAAADASTTTDGGLIGSGGGGCALGGRANANASGWLALGLLGLLAWRRR